MVGKVYEAPPMPPAPEHTTYLEQGPLRIGIEYRKLDPETIEQLRALALGIRIHVTVLDEAPPAGVDTPEDLERVRRLIPPRE